MNCDVNLGLPAALATQWAVGGEASAACFPTDGVFFLQEGFVKEIVAVSGLCPEAQPAFFAAADQIRSTPELLAFAWHCHWRLNIAPAAINAEHNPWPTQKAEFTVMGNQFFFVFPILAALPRLQAYYAEHGIPARILADTLHDLDVWAHTTYDLHGLWGYRDPRWLINHTTPNLFRLGRLQFQFGKRNNPCNAWRQPTTGEVVIFPPDGLPATADGFFGLDGEPQAFTTIYKVDADHATVTGTPVRPDGRLDQHPITLSLREWQQPCVNGDQVLNIHIPAGDPLDAEACRDSLRQAAAFFPRFFPDFQFKAIQCGSWLFDPQLADYLPAQTNLVRFQTLFHLYPMLNGNSWQIRQRVFGDPDLPLDKVPQKTSLQKIVHRHLQEGRQWRSGCVLILPEEIS
jgi:hypothetical protein